ncbi:hypothetical protein Nepgr_000957 [Nepenthes gracilis]|uniref:Glutaredoxin domain-containing protein n=1 Tax=Nepenthes gracilis TaxID=150966 RepID=A0AAD3RX91_NEPGR|nr:hypothetical protein Nepgr_000957 [Nepenthes gracilis]
MQRLQPCRQLTDGRGVRLELSTPANTSTLAIDVTESTEMRIQRLISENPVVIFARPSCCMCHVMKRLLSTIGVHPTVIELEEEEIAALPPPQRQDGYCEGGGATNTLPAAFIGGTRVGGLEGLVALHLSGQLVPKLVEIGALWP